MDAKAKGEVVTRVIPIDDESIGTVDGALIMVAGQIPHHDLVTFADGLASQLYILGGDAAHMHQWGLPADDF